VLIYSLYIGLVNWQDVDTVETGSNVGHLNAAYRGVTTSRPIDVAGAVRVVQPGIR
jgi:hypothetical protein